MGIKIVPSEPSKMCGTHTCKDTNTDKETQKTFSPDNDGKYLCFRKTARKSSSSMVLENQELLLLSRVSTGD